MTNHEDSATTDAAQGALAHPDVPQSAGSGAQEPSVDTPVATRVHASGAITDEEFATEKTHVMNNGT
jgi:hypothetical protein